jgi:hypothetical protein
MGKDKIVFKDTNGFYIKVKGKKIYINLEDKI